MNFVTSPSGATRCILNLACYWHSPGFSHHVELIICFRLSSVHALRLLSRTGKGFDGIISVNVKGI